MSLYFNGIEMNSAYFNGSEVKSIYFNNVLAWEGYPYIELEYIESTGTQYIDTGFKANNNTRVVMDACYTSTPTTYAALFGGRVSATDRNYAMLWVNEVGIRSHYNKSYNQEWSVEPTTRRIYDKNKETTTIDGVSQSYTNSAFTGAYNMALFALNNAGTIQWHSSIRLYSCQIYDNGTLIRDYIPVQMKDTAEIGLWDKINGIFYGNDGSGEFTYNTTPLIWPTGGNWASASWEDVYNLCKAKQNGEITEWPSDIVLGATKTVSLSTSVLGSTARSMTLIGIDIDGDGVLTFQSNNLASKCAWSSSTSTTWPDSTVRSYCNDFYNYCDAKPYIKTLSKGTALTYGASITYSNENVWILSRAEYDGSGASEFTKNVSTPYPYKQSVPSNYVWTRSRSNSTGNIHIVDTDKDITAISPLGNQYLRPCFAIG